MRDFPLNETPRGGEHAGIFAFRQNDLEMAAPCCIETTFDRIHVFLGESGKLAARTRP
jgi:hypothetical protein